MEEQSFIRRQFADFYKKNSSIIEEPVSIEQREFGFFLFEEGIVIRHKGFDNGETLRSYIREVVPSNAYYSAAYYSNPKAKMEEKDWSGADLFFDIDADHIPTECGKIHDSWKCKDCGFSGKGIIPEHCPSCNSKRFNNKTWPCEVCLEAAKRETAKLVNFLTRDFGFSSKEIYVAFSGHRGYHVNVENEIVRELDSFSRKEITDYITGVGLDTSLLGLGKSSHIRSDSSSERDHEQPGWRKRIEKGAYQFLVTASEKHLKKVGLKEKTVKEILSKKEAILRRWERSGPWNQISGISKEELRLLIHKAVKIETSHIDTVVTTDVHRLVRLTNSLHGKTGWLKVLFPVGKIEEFDPLKSAVAFKKGETTLYVEEVPQFRLGEEWFGPFNKEKQEFPMAAAIFLLCKGAAKVVK